MRKRQSGRRKKRQNGDSRKMGKEKQSATTRIVPLHRNGSFDHYPSLITTDPIAINTNPTKEPRVREMNEILARWCSRIGRKNVRIWATFSSDSKFCSCVQFHVIHILSLMFLSIRIMIIPHTSLSLSLLLQHSLSCCSFCCKVKISFLVPKYNRSCCKSSRGWSKRLNL